MHWCATCRFVHYLVYIADKDMNNMHVLEGLCAALGGMKPVQKLQVSKEEAYFLTYHNRELPGLGHFTVPQVDPPTRPPARPPARMPARPPTRSPARPPALRSFFFSPLSS